MELTLAFTKSHAAANLYTRSGIDAATTELLFDAEQDYVTKLEKEILPLAEEWWSHFSLRDNMQEGLSKDMRFPKKFNTYLAADYQDLSFFCIMLYI